MGAWPPRRHMSIAASARRLVVTSTPMGYLYRLASTSIVYLYDLPGVYLYPSSRLPLSPRPREATSKRDQIRKRLHQTQSMGKAKTRWREARSMLRQQHATSSRLPAKQRLERRLLRHTCHLTQFTHLLSTTHFLGQKYKFIHQNTTKSTNSFIKIL